MSKFKNYRKTAIQPMRPYVEGEDLGTCSIGEFDRSNGSPKLGDMIAQNPDSNKDDWLVAADFFKANYSLVE